MTSEVSFEDFFNSRSQFIFEEQGFVLGRVSSLERLLELANNLGTPIPMRRAGPIVDELEPEDTASAQRNSLSSRHGKGAFPLHTDCAFWPTPPKYLLLRSSTDAQGVPTRVAQGDWTDNHLNLLERARTAIFKVVNGRQSFLSSIADQGFLRFDRDCMIAASNNSHSLFEDLESAIPDSKIFDVGWSKELCLVLDNWRMLHGRASCDTADPGRVLHRILVRGGIPC